MNQVGRASSLDSGLEYADHVQHGAREREDSDSDTDEQSQQQRPNICDSAIDLRFVRSRPATAAEALRLRPKFWLWLWCAPDDSERRALVRSNWFTRRERLAFDALVCVPLALSAILELLEWCTLFLYRLQMAGATLCGTVWHRTSRTAARPVASQ